VAASVNFPELREGAEFFSMARANAPLGSPPPLFIICQNNEWL
jgi:hypothetical protein